jgi:hypothetical protein
MRVSTLLKSLQDKTRVLVAKHWRELAIRARASMKHSGYLFLLLVFAGCSSELQGNRVRIKYLYNETQPIVKLLNVSDSTLLVHASPPGSADTMLAIPFADIDRVYHGSSSAEYALLGAGAGFALGLGLASTEVTIGTGSGHPNLQPALNVIGVCIVAGAILGPVIHGGETAYYPASEADRKRLREFAAKR